MYSLNYNLPDRQNNSKIMVKYMRDLICTQKDINVEDDKIYTYYLLKS